MVSNLTEPPIGEKSPAAGKNLKILSFAAFVRMLGVSIIDLILVFYAISLGADAFLSGVAVGAFSITSVIFQIPVAKLSDKIGRKKTLMIGMGVFAIGTLLCGFAQNITQLIIFRLIQGSGAFISVIQAFIGDMFPSKERGRSMSVYQSGITLGYAVGLPLGGFLASLFLNFPFFVHFGLILVSLAVIYLFVEEPPTHKSILKKEEKKINYRKEIFSNKLFLLTTLIDCLSVFVFASLLAFIAKFALSIGIDTLTFSILMIPLVLMMTLGFFLGGRYSDRVGRSNTILIGLAIASPLLVLQGIVSTPIELIIISAMVVFGIGLAWPTIPALIMDSITESCRATGTSIYNSFRSFSNALGPIVMGYIIGIYSPGSEDLGPGIRITYYISGIIYLVACVLVFFFLHKFERNKEMVC